MLIRGRSQLKNLPARVWLAVLAIAWIGSALATVLFTAAIRQGSPTTAVLLQKIQPLFAIVMARLILKEQWPRRFPWLAGLAVFGTYLVVFGGVDLAISLQFYAALLALGAAAGWACSTIWGRIATKELSFEMMTALRVTCALPALLVAALWQGQTAVPSSNQLASLVAIAAIPGFAALMLYYHGLKRTLASRATIGELAFPVTAALLNWVVLDVKVSALQVAGFGIVWAAILSL